MNGTPHVKEPHLDPPDEESMWCTVHGRNGDECCDDEEDCEECELIEMSEHHQALHDDIMSEWFEEENA